MPYEGTKILEFNHYQKSDKAPFTIYTDLKCIIEKIDGCKSNPENSSKSSRNHMKMQKFVIYLTETLKMGMQKIKKIL